MTRRSRRTVLLLAFLIWVCYTVFFSVVKLSDDNRIDRWHLDIVFHFTAYLGIAVLGAGLMRWLALIPGAALAGLTELAQTRLPDRTASWSDFGVNLAGLAGGLLVWYAVARARRLRAERGIAGRNQR